MRITSRKLQYLKEVQNESELVAEIKRLRRKVSRQKAELSEFRREKAEQEKKAREEDEMHERTVCRYRGY